MALLQERLIEARRYGVLSLPIIVIALGWVFKGANTAMLAALLSATLLIVLLGVLVFSPASRVKYAISSNVISLLATLFFVGWTLFSAARFDSAHTPAWLKSLFHPAWRAFLGGQYGAIALSPYRALEGLASLLSAISAFALGALAVSERRDRDRLGRIVSVAAVFFAIYALALHFNPDNVHNRLWVNFGSANSAATLFGALCLFLMALIMRCARGRMGKPPPSLPKAARFAAPLLAAPVSSAALVLCVCALFLTASRAGIAATALSALIFFALVVRPGRQGEGAAPALSGLLLVVALLAFAGLQFAFDRLALFDNDAEIRRLMAEAHWRAFLARPVLGHGLNSFHELNTLYATPDNWRALADIGAAHNIFIQMLEESGLIGAAAYTLMLAPPLIRALVNTLYGKSGREWSGAALAAFALALIHGWVDFGLQTPAIAAFLCFMLGTASVKSKSSLARA